MIEILESSHVTITISRETLTALKYATMGMQFLAPAFFLLIAILNRSWILAFVAAMLFVTALSTV